MDRTLLSDLQTWLERPSRGALVLRGARQVGKTWIIRDLAKRAGRDLVEINFERDPGLQRAFESPEPRRVLANLGLVRDQDIDPSRSLLFLDEIQAAAPVLMSLRWFTEELPELPVVAAGSLLEFALEDRSLTMPVGRVGYRHLEPMSFPEYLAAHRQQRLLDELRAWTPGEEQLGPIVHERASEWYERYAMVGGMPAVVAADVDGAAPTDCRRLQTDLMTAYRDDFAKYSGRMDPTILDSTLLSVAAQLGSKFVYARVGEGVKQHQAKQSLELLARAQLVTLAAHSVASGIPLGGEMKPRNRKASLLDIGLAHALLQTPAGAAFPRMADLTPVVRGKLADQLAAQQLRVLKPGSGDAPSLHYWQREGGRAGEIDFLVQVEQEVVPVELKAGASGAMKSLHQFVHDKGLERAVRVDVNPPSVQAIEVKTTQGDRARYRLLNLPGYLLWRLGELVPAIGD